MNTRTWPAVLLLLLATTAFAASGVQWTPDAKRSLVNKTVGSERWAITCEDDGTITGNVYRTDRDDVAFVWCEPTGNDGNPDVFARQLDFDCYGADACPEQPCSPEQWTLIDEVTLPGAFCLPPAGNPSTTASPRPTSTPFVEPTPAPTARPTAAPTARPTPRPTPRPTFAPACCKVCTTGKACGDSCISRSKTCHVGGGCACNG